MNRTRTTFPIAVSIFLLAFMLRAEEELKVGPSFRDLTVSVPTLAKPPIIDGKVDPDEWKNAGLAPRLIEERDDGDDRLTERQGRFYFGLTKDAFYIAFQIQRPESAIIPLAQTAVTERDVSMWKKNDFIELHLNNIPGISRAIANYRDYYITWNLNGARYERKQHPVTDVAWNPDWDVSCRVVPGFGWEGEVRLPLKMFEHELNTKAGDVWRYNLFDNQATPRPRYAFSAFSTQWSSPRDYSAFRFTGGDGVFARVLDSGMMGKTQKPGVILELVNPAADRPKNATVHARLFKRKVNSPSRLSYLRAFDQSRDRPEDLAGRGKVATFLSDDKTSELLLTENYDLIKELKKEVTLAPGARETLECAAEAATGNYLVIYDVREAKPVDPSKALVAGGALPFVLPAPLMIRTENFVLVDKSVHVLAELAYIDGWQGKGTVEARVLPHQGDKVLFQKRWEAQQLGESIAFDIDVKQIPPGDYRLLILAQADGAKAPATREVPLQIPPIPKWFTEKAGLAPTIPFPWKPIEVTGDKSPRKVSFLMGDYELTDSAMPQQVNVSSIHESQRRQLLRAPMRLMAKTGSTEQSLTGAPVVVDRQPQLVTCRSEARIGAVTASTDIAFEYDGMAKVTLTLAPASGAASATLDSLWLEVPLHKQYSTLATGIGTPVLPAAGVKLPFTNVIGLGDEERRFYWFAENTRGWRVDPKLAKEAIEILNGPEGATLRIHFVNTPGKPLMVDKQRQIVFAFMFTPPRTALPGPLHIIYFGGQPDREVKEFGANAFERWNFYTDVQGWPEFKTQEIRKRSTEDTIKAHELGAKMMPYTGWFIHRNTTIYPVYGGEMLTEPIVDGGVSCDVVCWNTPVQDAFVSMLADRCREDHIDGYRFDAGFTGLYPCRSLKHRGYGSVCGWHDDDGKLQSSLGIFAARKAAERCYRLFHGGVIKDGLTAQWQTASKLPPIFSFLDACGSNEGPDTKLRTMKEYPLENYRATTMSDAFGLQSVYMPKSEVTGMDSRLGIALLHNMTPRGMPGMADREAGYSRSALSPALVWKAKAEWMRCWDKGTEFWGYWKNARYVQTDLPDTYASFYVKRGEKMLLAVMNMDRKPIEATVKIKQADLGFGKQLFAQDAISGEDIAIENGALKLAFTPESYRLVKLTAQKHPSTAPQKTGPNLLAGSEPSKWTDKALPSGWQGDRKLVQVDGKNLVILPGARLMSIVPTEVGKTYLLDVEARVDCDDGAYLGQQIELHLFATSLGDLNNRCSLSSQMLPGHYRTLRTTWKATEANSHVVLALSGAGKATVRHIELNEISGK